VSEALPRCPRRRRRTKDGDTRHKKTNPLRKTFPRTAPTIIPASSPLLQHGAAVVPPVGQASGPRSKVPQTNSRPPRHRRHTAPVRGRVTPASHQRLPPGTRDMFQRPTSVQAPQSAEGPVPPSPAPGRTTCRPVRRSLSPWLTVSISQGKTLSPPLTKKIYPGLFLIASAKARSHQCV